MAQKLFALVCVLALTASAFSTPTKIDFKPAPKLVSGSNNHVAKVGKYQKITLQDAVNAALKKVGPPSKLDATGDANGYVDALLAVVRAYMDELGLQSVALPDESVGFNTEFLFIPIYASVNLTNGFLQGMNTIHRTGDATITVSGFNLYISVDVGFYTPAAGYDITTDIEGLVFHGSVAATIQDISVSLSMFIDTENFSSYVETFDILDIGFITVTVTGLGIFNWLADIFIDAIANLLKNIVGNLLENTIAQVIQDVLDKIFPGNAALGGGFMKLSDTSVGFQKTIEFFQHKRNDIFKIFSAFM